jgi:nitrous oxidase accessory protein
MDKILLLFFIFISTLFSNILQDAIDSAPSGSTLKLSSGLYLGKIVINKPITIIGANNNTIIKGNNTGQVISINSSNVILKNLTITNSGNRMENLDSAIVMNKVKNCEIDNCTILNSLYGIDMVMVENSIISNNYITSKENDISLKGDALKIWYSNNNIIKNNTIDYSRDVTLTYSHNNKLLNNNFTNSRFGIHIHLSNNNLVQNNSFKYNSASIMVMESFDTKIINNQVKSSKGAAGIGIVLMGVSNLLLEENTISYNAKGIYIDSKTKEEGMQRFINNNEISYNIEALHFHQAIKNNTITNNKVFSNIEDIVKDVKGTFSLENVVEYNYWDRYEGFDKNKDNIGDNSYKVFQYADQLWHYNHKVKFFYASPVMSLMNFLTNIAPFIEPNMLFEDKKPLINLK